MDHKTKISVSVTMPTEASPQPDPCEVLRCRIEYAVDCIEADWKKEQALQFLRDAKQWLENIQRPKDKHLALKEEVNAALSDYGYYQQNGEDPEDA